MDKDNICGRQYIGPKGYLTTVVEVADKPSSIKCEEYICICSNCSKDEKLWPYGSITVTEKGIKNKRSPCCNKIIKYTTDQWKVLVKRKAEKQGVEVLNVYRIDRKKRSLRLGYRCNEKEVNGISVESFMKRCDDKKVYLNEDSYYIDKYFEGKSPEQSDKIFCRVSSQSWTFFCRTCKDALMDLCVDDDCIFITKGGSLLEGSVGCYCNSQARLTIEIITARVSRGLEKKRCRFVEVTGNLEGSDTPVKWVCENGHSNISRYSNIMSGKGCVKCRNENCGNCLYENYLYREDTLYFLRFEEECGKVFYKIGRSFNPDKRLRDIKYIYKNVTNIERLKGFHINIFEVECIIKERIKSEKKKYSPEKYFQGSVTECFTTEDIQDVIQFASEFLTNKGETGN